MQDGERSQRALSWSHTVCRMFWADLRWHNQLVLWGFSWGFFLLLVLEEKVSVRVSNTWQSVEISNKLQEYRAGWVRYYPHWEWKKSSLSSQEVYLWKGLEKKGRRTEAPQVWEENYSRCDLIFYARKCCLLLICCSHFLVCIIDTLLILNKAPLEKEAICMCIELFRLAGLRCFHYLFKYFKVMGIWWISRTELHLLFMGVHSVHSNFLHWGWTIVLYKSELKITHRMKARCISPLLSVFYNNNHPAENCIIVLI